MVKENLQAGKKVKIRITGSSMEPFISDGDTVVLISFKPQFLKLGMILLGDYKDMTILHRLVKFDQ